MAFGKIAQSFGVFRYALKFLLNFFTKKLRSTEAGPLVAPRTGRNSRPSQRAKYPLAAASETPAPRTARNPPSSQSAIRRWRNPHGVSRKAAVPTPRGWRTAAFSYSPTSDGGKPPPYSAEPIVFSQWSYAPFPRRFFLFKNQKSLYPFYIFYSIMIVTNTSGREPARRIFPCGYANN